MIYVKINSRSCGQIERGDIFAETFDRHEILQLRQKKILNNRFKYHVRGYKIRLPTE